MKIVVTNLYTGQHVKTIDYDGLLEICRGDVIMANQFLRLMRNHPESRKTKEKWTVVDDEEE